MTFSDPLLGGLSSFAGQTAGVQSGLQQQALAQQMQQFLMALQFQQQQAAQQQALNYATQFGAAPGGNYMTWGAGGPTQPVPGSYTQSALEQAFAQGQAAAGMTGTYSNPQFWTYQPGTWVRNSQTGAIGQIQGGGQLVTTTNIPPGLDMKTVASIDPAEFTQLQQGQGGGGGAGFGVATGPTQAAVAQQGGLAAQQAAVTGMYQQPMGNIAADAFQKASPQTQASYLQNTQGDTTTAANRYWADVQGAIQNAGISPQQFVYGTNGPTPTLAAQQQYASLYGQGMPGTSAAGQQTLQAINQAAQLSGMYQGAPTLAAQGQYTQEAQNWAQMYGYVPQLDANGQPVAPAGGPGGAQTLASQAQQAQLSGMYQGAPTEAAREFNLQNALAQGQLGQQYLSTAAQLQGPQNTFQLSNYLRGAQGNPNVPVYLQNLANNMGMPSFQASGTTAPTPQSAGGLTSQMGYGVDQNGNMTGQATSATPGWDYNQTLNQINQIAQRGAQGLAPGSLERLTPDEMQAFGSGLGAAGYSLPSFMSQYAQSRVGQQAPVGQTSLA